MARFSLCRMKSPHETVVSSRVDQERSHSLTSNPARTFLPVGELKTHRAGAWLPEDPAVIGSFLEKVRERAAADPDKTTLVPPVKKLDDLVRSDPALYGNAQAMFYEAQPSISETEANKAKANTKKTPEITLVQDWDEFIILLNNIVQKVAPEFYNKPGSTDAAGLVAFPINALLDFPMGTLPGFTVFSNAKFNAAMKDVLNYWTNFLTSPNSTYTLTRSSNSPSALAWLDPAVREQLVKKVNDAKNSNTTCSKFEEVFECDPTKDAYGFASWDDFFTKNFTSSARPVDQPDDWSKIANACESAPLNVTRNVQLTDKFWLKDQLYSLKDMMDDGHHQYAKFFAGGTVYQAYLSALSFHRWRSPVSGTVVASYNINGTYFLQSYHRGFDDSGKKGKNATDLVAPNDSQKYLACVAARSVIIIESDKAALGKVVFISVGMGECGSCENTVTIGEKISKGDQIGMFHYGGSTHCLVFQPHVDLEFIHYINDKAGIKAKHNIAVSSTIATVKTQDS